MADPIENNTGAFVPLTFIWDVGEIYQTDVNSENFKLLLVRLYQNLNSMQMLLNLKDTGSYDTLEFVNGQTYFAAGDVDVPRQVYRKVVIFGALPNSGLKSVAHNMTITPNLTFTRLYGAASDLANQSYLPIPNSDIKLEVDATNVKITTAANLTDYTTTYVVLEYLKL